MPSFYLLPNWSFPVIRRLPQTCVLRLFVRSGSVTQPKSGKYETKLTSQQAFACLQEIDSIFYTNMDALIDVIYLLVQRGELEMKDLGRLVCVSRPLRSSVTESVLTRTAVLRYRIGIVGKRCEAFEKEHHAFYSHHLQNSQRMHVNLTYGASRYTERLERFKRRLDRVKADLERLSKQAEKGGPLEKGFGGLEGCLTSKGLGRLKRCAQGCGVTGAVKRCNERFKAWAYRARLRKLMVLGNILKKLEKDLKLAFWIYSSEEVLHHRGY